MLTLSLFTYRTVSRIACSLLQQQWGCTSWAWWGGPCMEYEVQENYPRVCLSLPGTILCWEAKDIMLMNLDKYLSYAYQHNDLIGLAFTLTTCICKQMLIARDFSLEILFCFRISDIIQNSVLFENSFCYFNFYLKTRKPFCAMVEPQRRFVCKGIEWDCILLELSLLNKMKMAWGDGARMKTRNICVKKKAGGSFLVVFWKLKPYRSLPLCQAWDSHFIFKMPYFWKNYIAESKFNLVLSDYCQSPGCKSNFIISKWICTFSKKMTTECGKTLLTSCALLGLPLQINYGRRNTNVYLWKKRGGRLHFMNTNSN